MKALILLILFVAGCASIPTGPDFLAARASTVFISTSDGLGTGVALNAHCVLTVAHVADEEVSATTDKGTVYRMTRRAEDEDKDIAVVCSEAMLDAPAVRIRRTMPDTYAPIYSIGYPLGADKILTEGRYQGTDRMSVPLAPGNSGGGIFDGQQRLVGLADALSLYPVGNVPVPFTHMTIMVTSTDIQAFLTGNHIDYTLTE
jgi:S1-C subfamily serine protease